MENNLRDFKNFPFFYSSVTFSLGILYAENNKLLLCFHYLEITGIENLRMTSESPVDFLWFLVFIMPCRRFLKLAIKREQSKD